MSASDSDRVDWLESGCHAHMYNLLTGWVVIWQLKYKYQNQNL